MWRRIDVVLSLTVALVVVAPGTAMAQSPGIPGADLAARLPEAIGGGPVEVAFSDDMQTWVDMLYPGESHAEIEALQAALADQGRSLGDVATVTAYFGPDGGGVIQGFGIPGGDIAGLQEALVDAYLIGFGELERTQQAIGDHTVTMLSAGPLESEAYPTALLSDEAVLWIVTAEQIQLLPALEALLAVAAGTAPGNTATAPTPEPKIGPATWYGSMRQDMTWDREGYVGHSSAAFKGTWERLDAEGIDYCPDGPCAVYTPVGEVEWTFESSVPSKPRCVNRDSGSLFTKDVVTPTDQMLFLEPLGSDHLRYWGTGTIFLPPLKCPGWDGNGAPNGFFQLSMPDGDRPFADEATKARTSCDSFTWRVERDAPTMQGTCWIYDEPGFESRLEWDLKDVDPK